MRRDLAIIAAALLVLLPLGVTARDASPEASPVTDGPSVLFVIPATSGTFEGTTLTLAGVPSIIWFTDRPERDAGHVSVDALVEAWGGGEDDFVSDPPNAELSVLSTEDSTNAVLELRSVSGDAASLTFEVGLLEGAPPAGAFGPAALFIDACDPASPYCPPY